MNSVCAYVLAGSVIAALASAQTTQRVSVSSVGSQASSSSSAPSISGDGRLVAFVSEALDLVFDDANLVSDVFVRDLVTGQTKRASLNSANAEGNAESFAPSVSADGRYVAFASAASNLVLGDTNGAVDVFVRDLQTNLTTRVSVTSGGLQANSFSGTPSISADGRFVAFVSNASNLAAADTNFLQDIFVRDRQTNQTTRVSVDSTGAQADSLSDFPSISGDGRFVAFQSLATNLVASDTNFSLDVFVHDRQTNQTIRASVDSAGVEADTSSGAPSMSGGGRYVAFPSFASNLIAGDTNGALDVFVHDLQTNQTTRVSVSSIGVEGNDASDLPSISSDGRYVAFASFATNLVVSDTFLEDVFLRDRQTSKTTRVSYATLGTPGNDHSGATGLAISAGGPIVAFTSDASNFAPADTNLVTDVFVHDRQGVNPFTSFCAGDGTLRTPCPCAPPNTVPSPSAARGHGCANSFDLDGALLSAEGHTSPDTVTLTARIGSGYSGFGLLVKGDARSAAGFADGDGVRCTSGALVRFGSHIAGSNGAPLGYWIYPNIAQTLPVSAATAQGPAQDAWYQLFYRNSTPGFCSSATTNWSNGLRVFWP
jgi:Tol biopolymer transport system component